jgi:Helix-turn-helix domain
VCTYLGVQWQTRYTKSMETVTLRKAYRVRLVPTAAQQEPFLRWAGTRRDVYTWPPAWRKAYDHERGTSPHQIGVWRRHKAHSERS